MLKALILAVAVAVLVWLIFGRSARRDKVSAAAKRKSGQGTEEMVSCAHCGVHLPRGEALAARGLHYCSAAHRDLPPPA